MAHERGGGTASHDGASGPLSHTARWVLGGGAGLILLLCSVLSTLAWGEVKRVQTDQSAALGRAGEDRERIVRLEVAVTAIVELRDQVAKTYELVRSIDRSFVAHVAAQDAAERKSEAAREKN